MTIVIRVETLLSERLIMWVEYWRSRNEA